LLALARSGFRCAIHAERFRMLPLA
jgi:hypothetical protein